jgi:hypothetical protein
MTDNGTMRAYLRGVANPVIAAWLDQVFAATDDLRSQAGIESDHKLPWPSAIRLMSAMWNRLIDESLNAERCCSHLDQLAPEPTVIIPELQQAFCVECARECDWRELSWDTPSREVRALACDCCQRRRFKKREDVWCERLQMLNFIAPLKLCFECRSTLLYDRDIISIPSTDS